MVFFLPSVSIQSMVTIIAAGKEKKRFQNENMFSNGNILGPNSSKTVSQSQEEKSLANLTIVNSNVARKLHTVNSHTILDDIPTYSVFDFPDNKISPKEKRVESKSATCPPSWKFQASRIYL